MSEGTEVHGGTGRRSRVMAWLALRVSGLEPLALVAASWWVALVAIAVLQLAHADLHEHRELPILLHLLRDAALAVPAAGLAVGTAAVLVTAQPASGVGAIRGSRSRALLWAVSAAFVFAVLSIPGNQLHGSLFGAEEELDWLADVALDAVIALIGSLIALVPLAIVAGPPVRRDRHHPEEIKRGLARSLRTADTAGSTK